MKLTLSDSWCGGEALLLFWDLEHGSLEGDISAGNPVKDNPAEDTIPQAGASNYRALIRTLIEKGRFKPESGQIKLIETEETLILAAGIKGPENARSIRLTIGKAVRMALEAGVKTLEIDLDSRSWKAAPGTVLREAARAAWEGSYVFHEYRSQKEDGLDTVHFKFHGADDWQKFFQEGDFLGQAVIKARDAVNRTSRDMTPENFVGWVLELAKEGPYETEVFGEDSLKERGAKALLSVSAGSATEPAMIVLRYQGDPSHPEEVTALLGKGVIFDSGGLSLKSKTGMITMHHDMSGAAVAAAAFDAAARSGMKLNLTAILPICENMPSPVSYRPGDVIGTMDGKTVLIKSTDAEGRLVLADAMTWAIRYEKVSRLVDIATLTGGAVSAFGPLIHAVAVEDETLHEAVEQASKSSGELTWQMPLLEDYKRYLKAEHADLANSSNGAGSSMINGALFLKEFTQGLPWLHIDSAGPSWTDKTDGCSFYGATGAGCVLLYDLFGQLAGRE